jgi:beta-lactamase regulating signal transducer with metallopeptidase domain
MLTFLLNSLWQLPLAAGVGVLACRVMRNGPARHRHAVWVAVLAAALLLPMASVRRGDSSAVPSYSPSLVRVAPGAVTPAVPTRPAAAAVSRTVSFTATTSEVLLGAYVLFVLFQLLLLMWASVRTLQIRRGARAAAFPAQVRQVAVRCQDALGVSEVDLLFSNGVSGPVTMGRAIVLPGSLLDGSSESVLTTAIGHEMAHIARRDFACNLAYELLYLPISFHPAAWLVRREIARTREMACDELVTQTVIDATSYARSIVSIASAMTAVASPGHALGVFDGDILEERIRRLVSRRTVDLKRARVLLAAGLAALAICVVGASSIALTARAQDGAVGLMKQGEAAYSKGDYTQAASIFETAVGLEPTNLKAKMGLAKALMQQYIPGSEPRRPLAVRARQQLLEVLARDPNYREAIQGMMMLSTNTKQFAEAHDWAVKAIQADSTDKLAYYTAAFVDWVMTYPDYAAARQAAGMQMHDPGIISDTGLRQQVRTQHMAQIEDGKRMLETALQIDPDYADAMAYMNLLYRIEAGIADDASQYTVLISKADGWVQAALNAIQRRAQSGKKNDGVPADWLTAPPPPPPPPPPPGRGQRL